MGLLTLIFRLPLLPVRGFIRLGEVIQDEAERQLHDPARVRHELEQAEEQRAAGQISEDEMVSRQAEATAGLFRDGTTEGS